MVMILMQSMFLIFVHVVLKNFFINHIYIKNHIFFWYTYQEYEGILFN